MYKEIKNNFHNNIRRMANKSQTSPAPAQPASQPSPASPARARAPKIAVLGLNSFPKRALLLVQNGGPRPCRATEKWRILARLPDQCNTYTRSKRALRCVLNGAFWHTFQTNSTPTRAQNASSDASYAAPTAPCWTPIPSTIPGDPRVAVDGSAGKA